jgi:hypothetical protein
MTEPRPPRDREDVLVLIWLLCTAGLLVALLVLAFIFWP